MRCPWCESEMVSGYLMGDRYRAKWLPDSSHLLLGIWAVGGQPIGKMRFSRQRIKAHKCGACARIVIDLKDPEN